MDAVGGVGYLDLAGICLVSARFSFSLVSAGAEVTRDALHDVGNHSLMIGEAVGPLISAAHPRRDRSFLVHRVVDRLIDILRRGDGGVTNDDFAEEP